MSHDPVAAQPLPDERKAFEDWHSRNYDTLPDTEMHTLERQAMTKAWRAGVAWAAQPLPVDVRTVLERAERKLSAYVGVCKGDKELTDTVIPMVRAALAVAAQPLPADTERQATGQALLDAAAAFWSACHKERQYGAVQWLTGTAGELLIYTRGEYREQLMANIEKLPSAKTHDFAEAQPLPAPVAWQNKLKPAEMYEYEQLDPMWYSEFRPLYAAPVSAPLPADVRTTLERAERKLSAYVGVCKGDKELTDTVIPMVRAALAVAAQPLPDFEEVERREKEYVGMEPLPTDVEAMIQRLESYNRNAEYWTPLLDEAAAMLRTLATPKP
jgi:hypothetical protein